MPRKVKPRDGQVRPGATWLRCHYSSYLRLLFDEENRSAIIHSNFGPMTFDEAAQSPILAEFAAEGRAVLYQPTSDVRQPTSLSLEVAVGAAMTEEERKAVPWHPPQQAALRLPSGALRIECIYSCIGGYHEDIGLPVPAGDYVLELHRLNWPALAKGGRRDWNGPNEFLTLVPRPFAAGSQSGAGIFLDYQPPRPEPGPQLGYFRENGARVSVYNDATVVLLYDQDSGTAITQSEFGRVALTEFGIWDELRELSPQGILIAYGLYQDDELNVEIAVGEPLGPRERKGTRLKARQQAFFRLPTGKLCVESANTWPFGPEVASDRGQGAVIDVPPGDYVATIHWLTGSDYDGPTQFISLSPITANDPVPRASEIVEPTSPR
jgi:hypothetical protein